MIIKAPETMSAKERVRRTFNHEKTDRVTIGYEANGAIHAKLLNALDINSNDTITLYNTLGVDYIGIHAPYIGVPLFEEIPNRIRNQLEGCVMRWIEHETGGYWDFCDFPLIDADAEAFESFPVPNPDDFDYDRVLEHAKNIANNLNFALFTGGAGTPDIINSNGRIMGMEDVLCHLMLEYEPAVNFIKRRADFQLKMMERTIDKCKDYLDFIWYGEDLGTQHTPMISMDLYRKMLKPIHKDFIDLANSYNLPCIIHTCGSSSWVYNDFIEMGVAGVDTLQPEATNMSPRYLKNTFGNKLSYRGCISTAGALAYGTTDDVIDEVKSTLNIMMDGYGYHFAPTHAIQDNSPVENVIAMYQVAHNHGIY